MARRKKDAPASIGIDESWRARDDLRTLTCAAEIARDKGRMRAAQSEARRQMTSLQTVAGRARAKGSAASRRRSRLADVEL